MAVGLAVYAGEGACNDRSMAVRSRNVLLASVVTAETRRGSRHCKWNLSVSEHQAVTVTLHDFAVDGRLPTTNITKPYAILYVGDATPHVVYGVGVRVKVVHRHVGPPGIAVAIIANNQTAFLLHVLSKRFVSHTHTHTRTHARARTHTHTPV